jgi:ribosomal protein S18 acetylase RimI-like enzyme
MTELLFPVNGYALRGAEDDDRAYIMRCMEQSILLSVPDNEIRFSDLWMNDILNVTSIAIDGDMMRSEMFILHDDTNERAGILWMGISSDQFTCEDTGHLLGLFVNAELRKKGIGKALIGCAEEWCKKKSLMSLTLNVGSSNTLVKDIYDHLGFEERSTVMRKRFR